MLIQLCIVTPFLQNCRIIIDPAAKKVAVVDPGGDVDRIFSRLEGLEIDSVILTHAHLDHAGGVHKLLRTHEARYGRRPAFLAHPADRELRSMVSQQGLMFGFGSDEFEDCPEPDILIDEGLEVPIGSFSAKVRYVPGHAPGHIVLYFEEQDLEVEAEGGQRIRGRYPVVISGDTLLAGSIGRTDLPGGDHETLIRSIADKILTLPPETIVLSGHGPVTTVGEERKINPFLAGIFK